MSASKIARSSVAGIVLMAMAASAAYADTINLTPVAGGGTVSSTATTTTFTQPGLKGYYTSTNLDVLAGHTLTGVTPGGPGAISLIQVTGGQTNIGGTINSNGAIWIWNADGVVLHAGSAINAASIMLTTAGPTNPAGAGFFSNPTNNYSLNVAGSPTGSIKIDGGILTANGTPAHGGDIIILAPQVTIDNGAKLQTTNGQVQVLGGETMTADFNGDGLLNFAVIDSPVTTKATNGAHSTVEVLNGSTLRGGAVTVGVNINQDAVLDHVINLGGQTEATVKVGTTNNAVAYNKATNPQHVIITSRTALNVYEIVNPSTTANAGTTADAFTGTDPLTRSFASLGGETVLDTTNNPSISNVTYERPYRTSLAANLGDLNLLSPAAGGNNNGGGTNGQAPVSLGNLSPAAGPNTQAANDVAPGDLSPAAGGGKATNCGNSFLGNGWLNDPSNAQCAE